MRPNRISATTKTNLKKIVVYTVFLDEKGGRDSCWLTLGRCLFGIETGIDASVLEDEVASRAYLRGAFLSSGSIKDPEKESTSWKFILFIQTTRKELPFLMQGFLLDAKTIERKKEW